MAEATEPGIEELLTKLIPGAFEQMTGSTDDEIAAVEHLAGHALPKFYQWFLARMGRSMGPFSDATNDTFERHNDEHFSFATAI